jgi:hypothetical protein
MNKLICVKRKFLLLLALVLAIPLLMAIYSFCGFYVAQGGAKLFNKASQVIIARQGNKTVVTMSNDFSGDVKEFALVVPVPVVLKAQHIIIMDTSLFKDFDTYSAPRLVEYHDDNPCEVIADSNRLVGIDYLEVTSKRELVELNKKLKGVKIEAQYRIEEYDITILSAKEATALETWLKTNGYNIPKGARKVLQPYIKNNLKFFVVKVNLKEYQAKGFTELRPIQIEYEYDKFMLPIRLGMANSTGYQDLVVYGLSSKGRIETANYRTVPMPTDKNIPLYVKDNFGFFYKNVFEKAWRKAGKNAAMLEYAWDVSPSNFMKCDPCPHSVPTAELIANAGAFWAPPNSKEAKVHFTRLHLRYSLEDFPEDLMFIETNNTQNFQGRYIVTHMAKGDLSCEAGKKYMNDLADRQMKEIETYKELVSMNTETDKPKRKEDSFPFGAPNSHTHWPPTSMLVFYLFFGALLVLLITIVVIRNKRLSFNTNE